ncbi:MAG: hypothetical protein ABR604_08430 [Jatrophihabitantaceae bacterium]
MLKAVLRGAIAGAAGTTALNAVTYIDMAVRARPPSDTPQQAVAAIAERAGHPVPGHGAEQENRLGGLGPLAGIATGVGIGAAAGLLGPLIRRLPTLVGASLLGAAAMAGSDLPLAKLGLTNPSRWSALDWTSDVVPHFAYGLVTYKALRHR